jgi:hypothetical protein
MHPIPLSFNTSWVLKEQSWHTDEPYTFSSMRVSDIFHICGPTVTEIRYEIC